MYVHDSYQLGYGADVWAQCLLIIMKACLIKMYLNLPKIALEITSFLDFSPNYYILLCSEYIVFAFQTFLCLVNLML